MARRCQPYQFKDLSSALRAMTVIFQFANAVETPDSKDRRKVKEFLQQVTLMLGNVLM